MNMNQMQTFLKELKPSTHRRKPDPAQPVHFWSEQDRMHDKTVDAFVIILRTVGCSWMFQSGCTMCGYFNDSMLSKVTSEQIISQYKQAMKHYNKEAIVKIFTSGSFIDDAEVPTKAQEFILQDLNNHTQKIAIESRPHYITASKMQQLKKILTNNHLDIGIGLETSNDLIRSIAINKGFTFESYRNAVHTVHDHDFSVKTYVLIKPPFLSEKEAIKDTKQTIDTILPYTKKSDIISFNPTTVQKNTLVEYLWRRHQYRPPWLWSIIDILNYATDQSTKIRFQCDITGGGKKRGAHNCSKCNSSILTAIKTFSTQQNPEVLKTSDCSCKHLWQDQLRLEATSFGSLQDGMNP